MAEKAVAPTYARCCVVGPAGTPGGLRETVRLMNDDNSMRPVADVWIGAAADVERALNQVHADLDEKRHFILDVPSGNMAFLHSAQEVMVTSAMAYLMKGKRMSLYMLMLREAPSSKPEIKFGEDQ